MTLETPQRPRGHWKDVAALGQRARSGAPCDGEALRAAGLEWKRLYQRRRKRPGWATTVRDTLESVGQQVPPQLFFARIPLSVWPVILVRDWSEWHLLEKGSLDELENERILRKALAGHLQLNRGEIACLSPLRMCANEHGAKLYSCVNELHRTGHLRLNYRQLATEVAGRSYDEITERRSGSKIRPPIEHTQQVGDLSAPVAHPFMQSVSEVVVDGALARHVPDWCTVHQHAVSLATLVGGGDASFSIDIVLRRGAQIIGCVEVGAGGELSNETYRRRRAYKLEVLAGQGIPVHECDLRGGQRTMEALRHCIAWVQAQLGLPRSIDESFLRGVWTHPGITTVSYAGVEEHRQWLRSHAITTVDDYELKRIAQLKEGDELAGRIVPRGTLGEWLRANSMDWYELTGRPPTGRGSAKARRASATHQFYESYAETRAAARQLGATTPIEFQEMRAQDPRLRPNPDAYWPTEFKEDGWPGFLGTGASTLELAGMVASNDARQAMAMAHGRWIKTIRTLRPDATRRRGKDRYFRPARLVLHLVEAGVVGNAEADEVRGRLDEFARPHPHDLKTSAR